MNDTDAFRVLASADRQLVLHELAVGDGSSGVETLACNVAARRHGLSTDTVSDEQLERAQIRLVHQHVPLLLERDVVTVDWEDEEVALADTEAVDDLFEAADELEQWPPDDMVYDSV
ncbi:hypothetical protein RBH26_02750 [Natronolimnohabitans sp. A-GB9]|uniref:DUF7344 domain-containing protein n=1 Tax=Natronolimnohabitans sp. A-GB9 TaxID=3069757 RepID=UPI0027B4AEC1|nr:hypothetical protein [Natronolimnohabitans sp. A-GB9]MDQ2049397.1 hypothetical protein [Natronolimnohabitans sp. A-GB9]